MSGKLWAAPASTDAKLGGVSPERSNYAGGTYTIDIGDEIDISVVGHDELKTSPIVLQDGTISVPSAGVLHVSGLTVAEATSLLTQKLGVTINQPDVSVSILPANQPMVSVLGSVKNPGQYVLKKDSHVADVLAMAGGLNQDPKLTDATLVKAGGKGSVIINIAALINNTDQIQNQSVLAGDILFVTAIDERWLQVQVTGDVVKPGSILVPKEGIIVATALASAGGPLKDAALTQAQILHDGKTTTINLLEASNDLSNAAGKVVLYPGDVLSIPENRNMIGLIGDFQKPSDYIIPDGGSITVSQAMLLGGGLTKDANIHKASLLRYDSNGGATVTNFDIGKLLEGKVEDYKLQKGDIVYVPSRSSNANINPVSAILAAGQVFYWFGR
jgi:polysaccharide export outer membrane protein